MVTWSKAILSVAISIGVLNTLGFMVSVFWRKGVGSPWDRIEQLALLCTGQLPLMAKKFECRVHPTLNSKCSSASIGNVVEFLGNPGKLALNRRTRTGNSLWREGQPRQTPQGLMLEAALFCFLSQETKEGQLQLKSQGQGRHLPVRAQAGKVIIIVSD